MLLRLMEIHFEKTEGQIRNALLIDIHKLRPTREVGNLAKLVEISHTLL